MMVDDTPVLTVERTWRTPEITATASSTRRVISVSSCAGGTPA